MKMFRRLATVAAVATLALPVQAQSGAAQTGYPYVGHGDAVLLCQDDSGIGSGVGGVCIPQLRSGTLTIIDDSTLPVGGFWRWIGAPEDHPNRQGVFCGSTSVPSPPAGGSALYVWVDGPVNAPLSCVVDPVLAGGSPTVPFGVGTSGFVMF